MHPVIYGWRKLQVRFLGDKGGVTRLSYPTKKSYLCSKSDNEERSGIPCTYS
jgi:hypothetical protein